MKKLGTGLLALLLAACGGGSGGGDSLATPAAAPATVGVVLTDAPTTDVDEALARVTAVELFGDAGRQVIFTGDATLDLLRLRDSYEFFAVADDIRPGRVDKIRLTLASLELVWRDAAGNLTDRQQVRLPGNGKLDLNPRGPVNIGAGEVVVVTLDVDMAKSLKLTTTGNGKINLRPVVFVDIDTRPPVAKFTRVSGEIVALFPAVGGFRFCRAGLVADPVGPFQSPPARRLCLDVLTDADTGVFGPDGLPASYADLAVGDRVTVAGRLRPRPAPDPDVCSGSGDDPELCPLGSATGEDVVACPATDQDCSDNAYFRRLFLRAFVVEEGGPGAFRRVAGIANAGVDANNRFPLAVLPGQGFADEPVIAAQLYPQTRIFDRSGTELGADAIVADRRALLDAVLKLGDTATDNELRTALVILGADSVPEAVLLGRVATVDPLVVTTATGDRCVTATPATDVFRVTQTAEGLVSERIALADLEADQPVSVFGSEDTGGCFVATTIIAGMDMTAE